jgi:2-oxoglutarate ferredoxin oxidoreductase subunit gamma
LGGQGLVTLGAVLAASGARRGLQVAASQSYGSQARGGATRSDVILSAEEIDFPHVIAPDLLVVLAQEAYDLYVPSVRPGGTVLGDDFFVTPASREGIREVTLPGTRTAIEHVGNKVAANFVMFGALCGYTGLVSDVEVGATIEELVRERFRTANLEAFRLGLRLGGEITDREGPWR